MSRLFSLLIFKLTVFLAVCGNLIAGEPAQKPYPVVILGGGVGALTSALYLSRAGVEPIVIEGPNPGGLITQSHTVQNWPGELEITGADLAEKLRNQAVASGAVILSEEVVSVDFLKRPFTITTRSVDEPEKVHQIQAESCIIAMGTQSNYLGIPGESGPNGYWGRGVSNCAICDGSLYKNRTVGIVGGGDAAILEGLYLSNIAKEVHIFVRKGAFKGVEEKRLQTLLASPNVKVHYETTLLEIKGDKNKITHVVLKPKGKEASDFPLDGLFLAIGSRPNTQLFQSSLKLDKNGYIQLEKDQQASIEGVYAIGDIVDPVYKQAISAAGDGAKAAMQAQKYLSEKPQVLALKSNKKEPVAVSKSKKGTKAVSSMSQVVEIFSMEQFDQELKTSELPVVVDFYATWCGPCKKVLPLIEFSAGHLSGKVKFLKVNVDKFHHLSTSYQITSMPTVLVFDAKGSVVERKEGTAEISALLKRLESQN